MASMGIDYGGVDRSTRSPGDFSVADAENPGENPPSSSSKAKLVDDETTGVGGEDVQSSYGGYSLRELGRVGLLLVGALFLSVFAFSNVKQQYDESTGGSGHGGTFDIFKVTSLEDIPRDTMFANFSTPAQQKLFSMFLEKYSTGYDPSQYGELFKTFKYNLDKIDTRNAAESARGGSARHGITKFTGSTDEELSKIRGAKKPKETSDSSDSSSDSSSSSSDTISIAKTMNKRGYATPVSASKYSGTATSVDWSGTYTTSIRDQGYCGGCWAFSAAAQIESDGIRQGLWDKDEVTLSPQQLISCSEDNDGCSGGWTEFAFSYAMSTGLELESDYPYTSYDEDVASCKVDTSKEVAMVEAFYVLTSEDAMIDYIMETGPLSVCIDSSDWDSYVDGIVSSCGNNVDHCVQAVGVDLGEGSWKIRNTWGEDWGESGYIRLKTNENMCGITDDPIYTTVKLIQQVSVSVPSPSQIPTLTPTIAQTTVPTTKNLDYPSPSPTLAPVLVPAVATILPTPAVSTTTVTTADAPSNHPTLLPTLLPTLQPSLPVVLQDSKDESSDSTTTTITTSTGSASPTASPTLKLATPTASPTPKLVTSPPTSKSAPTVSTETNSKKSNKKSSSSSSSSRHSSGSGSGSAAEDEEDGEGKSEDKQGKSKGKSKGKGKGK